MFDDYNISVMDLKLYFGKCNLNDCSWFFKRWRVICSITLYIIFCLFVSLILFCLIYIYLCVVCCINNNCVNFAKSWKCYNEVTALLLLVGSLVIEEVVLLWWKSVFLPIPHNIPELRPETALQLYYLLPGTYLYIV